MINEEKQRLIHSLLGTLMEEMPDGTEYALLMYRNTTELQNCAVFNSGSQESAEHAILAAAREILQPR